MEQKQTLGPLQTKWVEWLRSGKYIQGAGALFLEQKYCCLGVAHKVVSAPIKNHQLRLSPKVQKQFGFYNLWGGAREDKNTASSSSRSLSSLNDGHWSFAEIADTVEKDPSMYFSEPR